VDPGGRGVVLTGGIIGLSYSRVFVSLPVLFCSLFIVRFSMLVIGFINVNPMCIFLSGEMNLNDIPDPTGEAARLEEWASHEGFHSPSVATVRLEART